MDAENGPFTPPREGFVETNGLRLHYLEWGRSGLPPAVLLHATGFLARLWQPIAQALSERFHVYAYDARGHGDSDKPPDGYHWQVFVDDLRGFLDALALEGVYAVGHSAGAAAAAHLAASEPRYISRAVLIEPIIFPRDFRDARDNRRNQLAEGARRRRMVWSSRDELIEAYRDRPTFASWPEEMLRLYAEYGTFQREDGQVELKCPGALEAQMYENNGSLNTWSLLPQVSCPTLLVRGEHTDPNLFRIAEGAAGLVPGARLVTLQGAGHFLVMEQPDAVARQLLGFAGEGPSP